MTRVVGSSGQFGARTSGGPIIVTPGDPLGIGAEVTVAALRAVDVGEVLVLGDMTAFSREGGDELVAESGGRIRARAPVDASRPVEWAAVVEGAQLAMTGAGRALVTGPIHKARLAARGFPFSGHTDLLASIAGVDVVMAFVGGGVRVALVTVHHAIADVPALVTYDRVLATLVTVHADLVRFLGLTNPKIAVCGLNPHAGEAGLLGREELERIGPAVEAARRLGICASGPISAEEAFMHPEASDLVLAMYHDQGLVALKRVDFGRSVNWTMGLPFVRTSVDHGTADALVGTRTARPDSMIAALNMANMLSVVRA